MCHAWWCVPFARAAKCRAVFVSPLCPMVAWAGGRGSRRGRGFDSGFGGRAGSRCVGGKEPGVNR